MPPKITSVPQVRTMEALGEHDASNSVQSQPTCEAGIETTTADLSSQEALNISPPSNPGKPRWQLEVERLHVSEWYVRAEKTRVTGSVQEPAESTTSTPKIGTHVMTAYYQDDPNEVDLSIESPEYSSPRIRKDNSMGPLRLVISSDILIRELQEISNVYLHQRPLALIPPFKLLVHNWDGIKTRLRELEDIPSSSLTRGAHTRLQHLQCLHHFVQAEMAYFFLLQAQIKDTSLQTVTFDQVYFLFSPGDVVVSSDTGTDQLYRVYGVSGGRIRLRNPDRNLPEERFRSATAGVGTWTDVHIECFLMAWDGKQLGPISLRFNIHHFIGKRNVIDLEVYPLRYLSNAQKIRDSVRLRGRRSFDSVGHRKHAGLTVPPHWTLEAFRIGLRDRVVDNAYLTWEQYARRRAHDAEIREINSDIYIDYDQGYRYNFENHAEIGVLARSYGDQREVNESVSSLAQMDISYSSGDHDVDASLTNDFLLRNQRLVKPSKPEDNLTGEESRLELLSPFALAYDFKLRSWSEYCCPLFGK